MIVDGRTLVVVADGKKARVFEESRKGGPLHEHAEWLKDLPKITESDHNEPGRTFDSAGHASHGMTAETPHDKAEREFVATLPAALERIVREHKFDDLVLIAPPRALGQLRDALPKQLQHKLKGSDSHERIMETAEQIHEALRAIRLKSA